MKRSHPSAEPWIESFFGSLSNGYTNFEYLIVGIMVLLRGSQMNHFGDFLFERLVADGAFHLIREEGNER